MREFRARWMRGAALATVLAALAMGGAGAQTASPPPSPRVALVIGEGAYRAGPRPAAPNDAGLVAQVLAGAGFDVTGARDLDGDGLRRAFRDFLDRAAAAGPDGIAVVYFAGRAVQADGEDFIVPVDARLARPADVPIETLRLSDFTRALAALPIQARVVVIDGAYAGGPAAGGPGDAPGLALVEAEPGELLAFNAAPGTSAPDAAGPYGAYAQALAAAMKQGGVPVGEMFDRVRLAVNGATGGAAVPWDSDRLGRSFAFFDRAPGAPAAASAQVPFAALEKRPLAGFPPAEAYDVAVARDTLPAYSEFLAAYPDDPLARRVRLVLAVRREALFWRAAAAGGTANSLWTYLMRYPKGPHAGDARRRLTRLAAAASPPIRFVPVVFDVPPPGPDEVVYDRIIVLDAPDLPSPPPPPLFLLPPPVVVVVERPPPAAGPAFLPVPVAVAIPFVRPPVEPGAIAPPRFVPGGYPRPRPYARGPNGDGLVVGADAAQVAAPRPPLVRPAPVQALSARPRPPAAPLPTPTPMPVPMPAPSSVQIAPAPPTTLSGAPPRLLAVPVPPSHALPIPARPAPPPAVPPAAAPHAPPATEPPAVPAPLPTMGPPPAGAVTDAHRTTPAPPPATPPSPMPAMSSGAAPPWPHPPTPADQPRSPAPARPQMVQPEAMPPKAAPRPASHPEAEPPRPAAPPASHPPAPARHAPDSPAPDRPAAAGSGHVGPERPPGLHRQACGHPGEPPCHP